MNLEKIVAVTGPSINGLFRMSSNRSNGLIVEELGTKKRKFVSQRRHNFTPMNSVGIYTDDGDAMDITDVFKRIMEQEGDNPPIPTSSSDEELREYFTDVLPSHDQDRVYIRDIKRVIKWYTILKEQDLLKEEEETENIVETEENTEETAEAETVTKDTDSSDEVETEKAKKDE